MGQHENRDRHRPNEENDQKEAHQNTPTSVDVARRAGVSQTTVSFALSETMSSRVNEETRLRVLAAAEELGYVPHAQARSLRAGRSNLVLVPLFDLPFGPLIDTLYDQLADRLNALGYSLLLHADRTTSGIAAARMWAALRPVALFVDARRLTPQAIALLKKSGTEVILTFETMASRSSTLSNTVIFPNSAVGVCAAEHLVARGHRHLAGVVPQDPLLRGLGLERFKGVERVGRSHGISVDRVDLPFDLRGARHIAEGWLQGPRPSGIFTFNDEYAMLLMRVLQDIGLRIPEDIALVGCDNLPLGELLNPRLTTVQVIAEDFGVRIADMLVGLIQGHPIADAGTETTQVSLVVRDSS